MSGIKKTFELGEIVLTRRIQDSFFRTEERTVILNNHLQRHAGGDDGDISLKCKAQNIYAHENGQHIFSLYKLLDEEFNLCIVTNASRSETKVCFNDETIEVNNTLKKGEKITCSQK